MSHLFDNYGPILDEEGKPTGKYIYQKVIPDNTTPRLIIKPGYDEVIVLGADNTHCFTIPHRFEEVKSLKIVYNQGIETKLVKEWPLLYAEETPVEEETSTNIGLGAMLGAVNNQDTEDISDTEQNEEPAIEENTSTTQQLLDELDHFWPSTVEEDPDAEPSPFIPTGAIHWDFPGNSKYWKSLISFDITAEETKNFNWYNPDVSVQVFITLNSGHFESQVNFKFDENESLDEILAKINFKGVKNPLEEDIDYEFIDEDDPFIPDGGPDHYDVSPIYKIKIVRKLQEGETK